MRAALSTVRRTSRLVARQRRGFTLIEVLVVVALVGILTSLGFVYARDLIPQYRTRSAALDFANRISDCRTTAISTGRACRVLLVAFDGDLTNLDNNVGAYRIQVEIPGGAGWDTLPIDTINDSVDDNQTEGVYDLSTGETKLRRVAIDDWGTIGGPGVDNDNAIVFDSRGFVANPTSDFQDGMIEVSFVNKVAQRRGSPDRWTVQVLRTGLTKLNSSRRATDDEIGSAGTASATTYDPAGPFGSP